MDMTESVMSKYTSLNNNLAADSHGNAATQSLLATVFNTSTLALHVLKCVRDESGNVVDFDVVLTNAMSDKMAGRKVCGMRMLQGWPLTKDIGLFDLFVTCVDSGKSVDYVQYYEGDGVRAWFRWVANKLDDGLYVTIEDVSSQKRHEEVILQTANRLRSALDGVPAIIALLDAKFDEDKNPNDFVITAANEATAKFTGYSVKDLEGKTFLELYPQVFAGQLRENYFKVLRTGEPLDFEFLYPATNRWLSIVVTRQIDREGIVLAILDITEKKRIAEEERKVHVLTSVDKLKSEFFSNISHEFRTPLALMLGPLEEVMNVKALPRHHVQKLDMVRRNALRLLKNVNALLDFSKMEAGHFETIFHPTDIAEFTTLLVSNFRSSIEKAGLKFKLKVESTESIYVNRDMWEKIVFNLLSNALKFTLNGSIEILLKSKKNCVQLHVCDSGVGISSENLTKIFDRFVRIENSKGRAYEGSGIGLALVRELVTIHGGSVKVKSKLNVGSEFIVTIPKGKKHLSSKMIHEFNDTNYHSNLLETFNEEVKGWTTGELRRSGFSTISGQSQGCGLILLVDDNADLREYIKSIVSRHFTVVDAANGLKAKGLLENGLQPDLILADVMMPEMNGYELLKFVKSGEATSRMPVVLLTARATEEDRVIGIERGAADYLVKPFSAKELLAVVKARISDYRKNEDGISKAVADLINSSAMAENQKKLFFQTLDVFPQMIWVFDAAGRVNFVNRAWRIYTGNDSEAAMLDQNIYFEMFNEDELPLLSEKWRRSVDRQEEFATESLLKDKSGNYHLHTDSSIPVRDESNQVQFWLRIFSNREHGVVNTPTMKKTKRHRPVSNASNLA